MDTENERNGVTPGIPRSPSWTLCCLKHRHSSIRSTSSETEAITIPEITPALSFARLTDGGGELELGSAAALSDPDEDEIAKIPVLIAVRDVPEGLVGAAGSTLR